MRPGQVHLYPRSSLTGYKAPMRTRPTSTNRCQKQHNASRPKFIPVKTRRSESGAPYEPLPDWVWNPSPDTLPISVRRSRQKDRAMTTPSAVCGRQPATPDRVRAFLSCRASGVWSDVTFKFRRRRWKLTRAVLGRRIPGICASGVEYLWVFETMIGEAFISTQFRAHNGSSRRSTDESV
jgi:hypothetical protein